MTPEEAAQWMLDELDRRHWLDHEIVTWELRKLDPSLLDMNASGNDVVKKSVLKVFEQLTKDSVVWSVGERHWRRRAPSDSPGRKQD